MIGGFPHAAQVIVDTGVLEAWLQHPAGQGHIDAQTTLGIVLETTAVAVESTEAVVHLRVQDPEAAD